MKKILILILIFFLLATGLYLSFFKEEKPSFTLAEVTRGDVFQEVSETGTIKKGEEINLGFKNAGRIEKIYVEVGDKVLAEQPLMKLETDQLYLQLKEAEANFEAQRIKLEELKKGTRIEEIKISQTSLDKAKTDLDNLYKATGVILNQTYNLAESTIRQTIAPLFLLRNPESEDRSYYELTYRYCNYLAANESNYQRKLIETDLKNWSKELQNLDVESITSLENLISKSESYLKKLQEFLKILNETFIITCNLRTQQDIDILNNYKFIAVSALRDINSALDSLLSHSRALEAQKLTVQYYQDQLNLKLAGATPEQIAYQEALVKQAESSVSLLKKQIEEATLKSPTRGEITKIKKEIGEIVQPVLAESIISLLPDVPFQIKVDIYEEDVVKIDVGDLVDIALVAFPEKIFKGKVISIDPASKIIEGVVYYETTVNFDEMPEGIRPGLTADLTIRTTFRENVLIIPGEAIQKKDGKTMVQVFKDGLISDREIEIGLRGSDNMVEVISGLAEGEKVILR